MAKSPRLMCRICKVKHDNGRPFCDKHLPQDSKGFKAKAAHPMHGFYHTAQWRAVRAAFLRRNPACAECSDPATVVDHIVPIRKGGHLVDEANLQAMCASCHNRKTAQGG